MSDFHYGSRKVPEVGDIVEDIADGTGYARVIAVRYSDRSIKVNWWNKSGYYELDDDQARICNTWWPASEFALSDVEKLK